MNAMRLCDVSGDGHCYYRCVWQVAKDDASASEVLYLYDKEEDETEGAKEVSYFVALNLKHYPDAIDMLRRLLILAEESATDDATLSDLKNCFPILEGLTQGDEFDHMLALVRDKIQSTCMYASSFEHEIVSGALSKEADLRLLVLYNESGESKEDLVDKWLGQLNKLLPQVYESRVAVLINCDNLHYMYATWGGSKILRTVDLVNNINMMMAMDSESE